METQTLGRQFLAELEMEARATRKCIATVPEDKYSWKPHKKSMNMGYLTLIVAEIPKWIHTMATQNDLDFMTYEHFQAKTTAEMVQHFDENMDLARKALQDISDDRLHEPFSLKANGQILMTSPKKDNIGPSINHLVHHRGQLTVYLRLCELPVPSIYGPSADDQGF